MGNFVKDLWQVFKKYGRGFRIFAVIFTISTVIFLFTFVMVSDHPKFCTTCHIMQPYYDSWKTSTHNEVNCLDCHFEPGIGGFIKGKYTALSQVAQYITGTYGTRFWAEIEDSSCLREGCHSERLLEGNVNYLGRVNFDHTTHLGELRRGKELKCTSCHSAIAMGDHLTVTESVCFTCHFIKDESGENISNCTMCHGFPKKETKIAGMKFNHSSYVGPDSGITCEKCHTGVTVGDGIVKPHTCTRCHPDRSLEVGTHDELHKAHITDHKVECFECHDEIEHGSHNISPMLEKDCASCHGNMHGVQSEVYIGFGGDDVKGAADPMFAAGVGCDGCHTGEIEVSGHTGSPAHFPAADTEACADCHKDDAYTDMLLDWQKDTRTHYTEALRIVNDARGKVGSGSGDAKKEKAGRLMTSAEKNMALVKDDKSWGAHNVVYTNRMIEAAVRDANEAVALYGYATRYDVSKFEHSTETEGNCATRCHFGADHTALTVKGRNFDHEKHVLGEELECRVCHDKDNHPEMLKTAYDCSTCHHEKKESDCTACHTGFTGKVITYQGKPFKHSSHLTKAGLKCSSCHPDGKPVPVSAGCISCHHKESNKDCGYCHNTQLNMYKGVGGRAVADTPSIMPGLKCPSCHTEPAPPKKPGSDSCTKCHKDTYSGILTSWQKTVDKKLAETAELLGRVKEEKSKLEGVTVGGEAASELYENAKYNYNFVKDDGTRGGHNQKYANSMLKQSQADLEAILEALE